MQSVLLMNGPNLNMLGQRNPTVYGNMTLSELESRLTMEAKQLGVSLECFQSNHEDELAQRLCAAAQVQGVILNAGAYTHTSQTLAEAIAEVKLPVVEVHLSNIFAREPFRHISLLSPYCFGSICGLGYWSYIAALHALLTRTNQSQKQTS